MAEEADVLGMDPRDGPDFADLMRWWRTHRGDLEAESEPGRQRGVIAYIGKVAAGVTMTQGELTAPDNVVDIWIGPAHGSASAATGRSIAADYAVRDFDPGDWVWTLRAGAKWYVTPFQCAAEAE